MSKELKISKIIKFKGMHRSNKTKQTKKILINSIFYPFRMSHRADASREMRKVSFRDQARIVG